MQDQKTATLKTIFSDVLADLAFMFTDDEAMTPSPDEQWLETTIRYVGHVGGTLQFRCTSAFSRHLAANLLGTGDPDGITQTQAADAVKEFMNILCGQLVTAFHGTEDVFNLTIPEVWELPESPDLSQNDGTRVSTAFVEGFAVQCAYAPDAGA
jgi:CheY-specific phosphatase CheX